MKAGALGAALAKREKRWADGGILVSAELISAGSSHRILRPRRAGRSAPVGIRALGYCASSIGMQVSDGT